MLDGPRWMLAIILFIGANFSASYLVPLDEAAQKSVSKSLHRSFSPSLMPQWPDPVARLLGGM